MATDEKRAPVPAAQVFGDLTIAPLPEGTKIEAAYLLIKLDREPDGDDDEWCVRSIGERYNRVEFLGQLVSYTHALTQDESNGWFDDDDAEDVPPSA
jgi:hypothetical protein